MHKSSYEKMKYFVDGYLTPLTSEKLTILDVGGRIAAEGQTSYYKLFNNENWRYNSLDVQDGEGVSIVINNPYSWNEIGSNTYDVVISGQVLEHVEFFWISIYEMARVLKPGGLMCIIAPASGIEHKYPVDCFRYYPDGFSALIKYISFDLFEIYTQFEKKYYIDGSDSWKDSFLVAQKPTNMDIINFEIKNLFSTQIMLNENISIDYCIEKLSLLKLNSNLSENKNSILENLKNLNVIQKYNKDLQKGYILRLGICTLKSILRTIKNLIKRIFN